jgi:hypothetical protein
MRDHAAEAAQRRASAGLVVIGKAVQIALHGGRSAQPGNEPLFRTRESGHSVIWFSGHRLSIEQFRN